VKSIASNISKLKRRQKNNQKYYIIDWFSKLSLTFIKKMLSSSKIDNLV